MTSSRSSFPRAQRGAATVVVVLVLLGAILLGAAFANRGLLLEARMSANQARSTVAFEAAEAGLEWTLAQINRSARIGVDCRPDVAATTSFRERYLAMSSAGITGRLGAGGAPLHPACVRSASGWTCGCPTDGAASVSVPSGEEPAAAFTVDFLPGGQAGVLRVAVTGCADATCTAGKPSARVESAFALVPAIATAPAAPLTVRGNVGVGAAPLGLHNTDPAAGVALHAGGLVDAASARITMPAGASLADAFAGQDAALAALTGDRLFVSIFGLSKPAWQRQPVVRRLACSGDCSAGLAAAIGSEVTDPLVWVTGDASIAGPVTLGSPERPVAIVVDGRLELRDGVVLHGVVYAGAVTWSGSAAGAQLHGALVSESGYGGDAGADLHRDTGVLALLRTRTGSFVRVAGSWRDF
jgi:hypothetical protein